jgi:hypothetical protein
LCFNEFEDDGHVFEAGAVRLDGAELVERLLELGKVDRWLHGIPRFRNSMRGEAATELDLEVVEGKGKMAGGRLVNGFSALALFRENGV